MLWQSFNVIFIKIWRNTTFGIYYQHLLITPVSFVNFSETRTQLEISKECGHLKLICIDNYIQEVKIKIFASL